MFCRENRDSLGKTGSILRLHDFEYNAGVEVKMLERNYKGTFMNVFSLVQLLNDHIITEDGF